MLNELERSACVVPTISVSWARFSLHRGTCLWRPSRRGPRCSLRYNSLRTHDGDVLIAAVSGA